MTLIAIKDSRSPSAQVRVKLPGERRSLSRSATRALDVLELFGAARRPLRAVEIARALDIHASTANQLLKTMVDSAHLVFDARGKTYLPSSRLAQFSGWMAATYGADEPLREVIDEVHATTGMVVTISTPNDLFMQVIDCAVPPGQIAERGLHVSLFGSALGSAYLSTLEDAEIRRLADRARIPTSDLAGIFEDLVRIRRDGFADGASAGTPFWSMAMPMPVSGLRVPTVLGLAGAPEEVRDQPQRYYRLMRQAITRWSGDPRDGA